MGYLMAWLRASDHLVPDTKEAHENVGTAQAGRLAYAERLLGREFLREVANSKLLFDQERPPLYEGEDEPDVFY